MHPSYLSALLERGTGPCPLGVYLPAGYPSLGGCGAVLERAVREGGASFIELGVPTYTPHLDGAAISQAHHQAMREGTDMVGVLTLVAQLAPVAPVVVMSYARPVLRYGIERWAEALAYAGAAGCMLADLPEDEAISWHAAAAAYGLHAPRLLEATAREARVVRLSSAATGWIYLPAAAAVTGYQGALDPLELARRCAHVRLHGGPPVVCGGGISTPELAADLAPLADALVIGSPLVRELLDDPGPRGADAAVHLVRQYTRALHQAITPHRSRPGPETGSPG
ncbi:hypothetical protein AN218_15420 [Streptomyces nanshensis]|uniref:tryptophan synthase n=1 Tax=Streptomyces nanshensis TaxID=518642 RepID=A0A1E7L3Z9_9ACTN|nr:hypothetical protein AN218_15420 [Streptomyces nanshensis]